MNIDDQIAEDEALEDYVPRKRTPEKVSKARNYLQLLVEQYEPYLKWRAETFYNDRKLLYLKASQLVNKKSDSPLKAILEWSKTRRVHVLAVVKMINKHL